MYQVFKNTTPAHSPIKTFRHKLDSFFIKEYSKIKFHGKVNLVIKGIKLKAHPRPKQKELLSQWMGCFRFIWNAKCEEDKYLRSFAHRYLPINTFPQINQKYSQYKSRELSPWLFDCPSQLLRNSASNWYNTYQKFLKGECGRPKRKRKESRESIHLTKELFCFEKCDDGVTRLNIGTKKFPLGYLSIKNHGKYSLPNSLYISKKHGHWWVSFSYDNITDESSLLDDKQTLEYLRDATGEELEVCVLGIDRGVKRPIQTNEELFDFTLEKKNKKKKMERYTKMVQRRFSKSQKGSRRSKKRKVRLARYHDKISNIRKDFCHKASRAIVDKEKTKVIVLEDLHTKNMTKKPKSLKDDNGNWKNRRRKQKAGLNKAILDKGWCLFENYLCYKAKKKGKVVFKIDPSFTSQECADCGHTHPNNRVSQEEFHCGQCGNRENADKQAARVIKKRAINFILDSGTELSSRGVLLDTGRGANCKTKGAELLASGAGRKESSKKKVLAVA